LIEKKVKIRLEDNLLKRQHARKTARQVDNWSEDNLPKRQFVSKTIC